MIKKLRVCQRHIMNCVPHLKRKDRQLEMLGADEAGGKLA